MVLQDESKQDKDSDVEEEECNPSLTTGSSTNTSSKISTYA